MKIYGLTGFPLEHSRSPEIFSKIYKEENCEDAEYRLFPLQNIGELPSLLENNPEIEGLNVTIPHKQAVLKFADHIDETVKQTESANTLKIIRKEKNLSIHAFNTDVFGFEYSVSKYLKPFHKRALILGSGGSSKSVQYVLRKWSIPFLVISRKPGRDFHISYGEVTKEILSGHQLIINTTPLGMFPETEQMPPLSYRYITASHLLFDLIYNPPCTQFLRQGLKAGARVVNGWEMLLKQAEKSHEIWKNKP